LYEVAACHDNGKGARQNRAEAIRWYRRAQAAGHRDVERALRSAARLLPRISTGGKAPRP
jgi:TPR repeat protein